MTTAVSEKLKAMALDLTTSSPRSPRDTLAGYVIAARTVDRCRALLNGTLGSYKYNGGMDQRFFAFTGIDADAFKVFIATGASDGEAADWIERHAKSRSKAKIIRWNNEMRSMTIRDLTDQQQLFMEDYIPQFVPTGKLPRVWFDVYDMEEGRL
jgi:hypothetical protein